MCFGDCGPTMSFDHFLLLICVLNKDSQSFSTLLVLNALSVVTTVCSVRAYAGIGESASAEWQ